MAGLEVRTARLDPMCVASARAVSATPERDAWAILAAWAGPKGLLADPEAHPIFGFNNPSPTAGVQEYGYEFWIRVGPDAEPDGKVEVKQFPGGLYAVTTCKGVEAIGETWMQLLDWVRSSRYTWRQTHELEKLHGPPLEEQDLVLDLYLPIDEGVPATPGAANEREDQYQVVRT